MTTRDPYDEEDVEPVGGHGKRRRAAPAADVGDDSVEGDGIDRTLAFKRANDRGNADRLIARHGEDMFYVPMNGWFIWRGHSFEHDPEGDEALIRCHQTAEAIYAEARALEAKPGRTSPERIAQLFKWAETSGNEPKARSMLAAARPYLAKRLNELDSDPFLAACENGTILLRNLVEQKASERKDLITRRLGVPFVEGTPCPRWTTFLERVMPDPELRAFLQRCAGYWLTGSTREECIFIFYGTGLNGKSTFVNVVRRVMGGYAMHTPVATFLAKREGGSGSEHSADVARLVNIRLLTVSEPPQSGRLDESRIKDVTSKDPITARHLREAFFEFLSKFKVVLSTNHYPVIRGTDFGIWRRIRMVPWTVTIPEDEVDRELEAKLVTEAPGVLQWMLDGVEEWLRIGLAPPEKARNAVEEYRAAQDPVGEFLAAKCEITGDYPSPSTGRPYEVTAKAMRDAYKAWCEEEGLDPIKGNVFGARLLTKGITKRKTNGCTVYVGVHLNWEAT